MYELPANFTGYNAKSILEFNSFKTLCYSLYGYRLFEVIEIFDHEYPKNYFEAKVKVHGRELSFLQNKFVLVTAFCSNTDDYTFTDVKEVEKVLGEIDDQIVLLTSQILNAQLQKDNIVNLPDYEKREVKQYLSCKVGEVLFSPWFD